MTRTQATIVVDVMRRLESAAAHVTLLRLCGDLEGPRADPLEQAINRLARELRLSVFTHEEQQRRLAGRLLELYRGALKLRCAAPGRAQRELELVIGELASLLVDLDLPYAALIGAGAAS